jgi:hypothetical protein
MNYPMIDVRDLCKALGVEYNTANTPERYLLMVKELRLREIAAQQRVQRTDDHKHDFTNSPYCQICGQAEF